MANTRATVIAPLRFDWEAALLELRFIAKNGPTFSAALKRDGAASMLSSDPNLAWMHRNGWISPTPDGWIATDAGHDLTRIPHCSTCACRLPKQEKGE